MPDAIDTQAFLKLCEMSIDNMYELEALRQLLGQRGLLTKQEIIEKAKLLKEQDQAKEKPISMNQSFTEVENAVIERIMEIILQSGLSSQQAQTLLKKTITLLEWGRRLHQRRCINSYQQSQAENV